MIIKLLLNKRNSALAFSKYYATHRRRCKPVNRESFNNENKICMIFVVFKRKNKYAEFN